ncbi:hypothetical protein [Cytobacillus gottheilii]|uniref:hypothetical protein n=1 Tax=Cytobacillus gottheilii TaxID=859144 RepID=UPI0009BAE089|nr:hypothetical protein [Cytobacillus gottheilii]
MNKWLMITGAIGIILLIVALNSKFYYPSLPIDAMSKKEILNSLQTKDMIKIGTDQDYDWFIAKMEQGKAYKEVKDMIQKEGWKFQVQEGSGFFFEKENESLIASTRMWTGDYVLVNVPLGWKQ